MTAPTHAQVLAALELWKLQNVIELTYEWLGWSITEYLDWFDGDPGPIPDRDLPTH